MSLYRRSLLAIIKNENLPVDDLPKLLVEDIKLLKSFHQKLNQRKQTYNQYYNSLSYIAQLTWECLTCADCGYNCSWPIESGYCFTHSELIDSELADQKELKQHSVNAATIYTHEKMRICSSFPQLKDIVEKLEGTTILKVDYWEAI